jgi:hypothetical protein
MRHLPARRAFSAPLRAGFCVHLDRDASSAAPSAAQPCTHARHECTANPRSLQEETGPSLGPGEHCPPLSCTTTWTNAGDLILCMHINLNKHGKLYRTRGQVGCSDRLVSALRKVQVVCVCVCVCVCDNSVVTRKATP